jgi:signal transduction histidine kinase
VFGNEELLFTAIKNIVVNACKYSSNQQAIIRLNIQFPEIIIEVQDKGSGIPQDEIGNIFQPFYRVAGSGQSEGDVGGRYPDGELLRHRHQPLRRRVGEGDPKHREEDSF